ncbi:mitochondrial ribosomal protein s16 [Colletotrichum karsti]|uniref:Mitochondrial ribosomal protein s16 n=1 Tax=Colletotrichum karsti TaxID=1095194 RepID=A0A9P6I527_9PEZI|nr:mitochondrial ribosomal protein s16 [Colletotrichum karsti]KAF9875171.1 mitochondrial ribosomal protein s16 [Colletotrichum karsti]
MVVRIRLARFGRVNQPFYNIVVSQARTARNSKPIEVIGTYDPVPKQDPYDATTKPHKDIRLDSLRARYWIGVGAQPTETVWRLLSMVGILEPKYRADGALNTATAAKSLKNKTPAPKSS